MILKSEFLFFNIEEPNEKPQDKVKSKDEPVIKGILKRSLEE